MPCCGYVGFGEVHGAAGGNGSGLKVGDRHGDCRVSGERLLKPGKSDVR